MRFKLTGERAIDVADASGTLLLDVARRQWSAEVLTRTQIDRHLLPSLHESPAVCGRVTERGAAATGLRAGTPVVAGAGDQAAGAVGMGIVRPGTVSATIGTWAWCLRPPIARQWTPKEECIPSVMLSPDGGM